MLPNIKTDRLSRNPLTSCVGQARLYVRDAGQEDRIVLVSTVGTEDVFVPVVHISTVLHQIGIKVLNTRKPPALHAGQFPADVVDHCLFRHIDQHIGRGEEW